MEKIWKTNNTLRERVFDWEYWEDHDEYYDALRDDSPGVTAADFDSYCHYIFVIESKEAINALLELIEILGDEEDEEDEIDEIDEEKLESYSKKFLDTVLEYLEKKEIKEVACYFLEQDFTYGDFTHMDWLSIKRKLKAEHKSYIEMVVNVDGADIDTTRYYPATLYQPEEGGEPYETSLGPHVSPTLEQALKWSEEDWSMDEHLYSFYLDAYWAGLPAWAK